VDQVFVKENDPLNHTKKLTKLHEPILASFRVILWIIRPFSENRSSKHNDSAHVELWLRAGWFLRTAIFLHQVDRFIGQLEQMGMRAVAVGQNGKAQFAIPIAK